MSIVRRMIYLTVTLSMVLSALATAAKAEPTAQLNQTQIAKMNQIIAKEKAKVDLLNEETVVAEFEHLAALIYSPTTKDLMTVTEQSSDAQKHQVASIKIRYEALKQKVTELERKEEVYTKLFGTRGLSPYYGAVSQDEFRDEGYLIGYYFTGSPIFLILYVMANMGD